MRNLVIATCCAALIGSVSMASAQTPTPAGQDSMKTHSSMDASAQMTKKKKMKKSKKEDGMSKGDMSKDDMKK